MMMWQFMMMAAGQSGGGGGGPGTLPLATNSTHLVFTSILAPNGIDLDSAGNLWVGGFSGRGIRKMSGFSDTLLNTYDASGDYRGIFFDGTNIRASEFDDGEIYSISTSNGTRLGSTSVGSPRDIAVFTDLIVSRGNTVVTVDGFGLKYSYNSFTNFGFSSTEISAIGCDGVNLMIGTDIGEVRVVDAADFITGTLTTLASYSSIGYNPSGFMHDGTHWYGCDRGTNRIYKHDNA